MAPQYPRHPRPPLPVNRRAPQFLPAGNRGSVIQRNGESLFGQPGRNMPTDVTVNILGNYLNDDDRQNVALVSRGARALVETTRNQLALAGRLGAEGTLRTLGDLTVQARIAADVLRQALVRRYGHEQIALIKRNGKTLIDADRIVKNILTTVQKDPNKALALQLLVTSTGFWPLIKLQGKPGTTGVPKNRDGLIGALAKLAAGNSEAELKGALGEIHDAIFFSRRFGMVTMDQTKTYSTLIHGQYLDTEMSKQMDLVFSHGGSTHYVETKFDVTTAI